MKLNRGPRLPVLKDSIHTLPPCEVIATLAGFELPDDRTVITKWGFNTGEEISRVTFIGTDNWDKDAQVLFGRSGTSQIDDLEYELEQLLDRKFSVKIRPKVGSSGKNVVSRLVNKVEED